MQIITGPDGKVRRRRRKRKVVEDNAVSAEALAVTFAAAMGLNFTENGDGVAADSSNQDYPETNAAGGGGTGGGGGGSGANEKRGSPEGEAPQNRKKTWWGTKK